MAGAKPNSHLRGRSQFFLQWNIKNRHIFTWLTCWQRPVGWTWLTRGNNIDTVRRSDGSVDMLVLEELNSRTWVRRGCGPFHGDVSLVVERFHLETQVWHTVTVTISRCLSLEVSTSSTAQGGGGSFKNRKRIGEIDCCEWRMSEQKHWPTD